MVALMLVTGCYTGTQRTPGQDGGEDGAEDGDGDGGSDDGGDEGDDGVPTCLPEGGTERASLRRLTRFEYNNTVRDLLGDDTSPANALPSEELANGFGNDADAQSVSSLLVETYNTVAEDIALRATETPTQLAALSSCAGDVTAATSEGEADSCTRTLLEGFLPRAYRRPVEGAEIDELVELATAIRAETDFATGVAGALEAILQSPDFLYRVEQGFIDGNGSRRPTGHEMASRLSYLLWGTMPDEDLFAAAEAGELESGSGVLEHAERMLADERSRPVVRFFFDNLLPISALSQLERDAELYPTYTAAVGAAMREETQTFLAHEIFEGPGTWDHALTAPYTFVNETLAEFYGIEGVTGDEFVKVDLDTSQRLGLLTQAGIVAGTIHSNETNPVVRGAFLMRNVMCTEIPLPEGDVLEEVKPPDPGSGATARERYSQHSEDPVCSGCHALMDPVGLALENYDAVGAWRDTENGVTIDPSGEVPGVAPVDGPIALVETIASAQKTHDCFALKWADYAYGRSSGPQDQCTVGQLREQFSESGHDIQQLLLDLTQTDDFLFMPEGE